MTLVETVIALALAAAVLVVATTFSIPMLARESMRSSIYDVQTAMQVARVEAVTRNRDVRFELNSKPAWFRVVDVETGDVLHRVSLPGTVSFARPDAGQPIQLPKVGPTLYRVTFFSDGTVSGGGEVCLHGGKHFRKLSLFGAGGSSIQHWNGNRWLAGS